MSYNLIYIVSFLKDIHLNPQPHPLSTKKLIPIVFFHSIIVRIESIKRFDFASKLHTLSSEVFSSSIVTSKHSFSKVSKWDLSSSFKSFHFVQQSAALWRGPLGPAWPPPVQLQESLIDTFQTATWSRQWFKQSKLLLTNSHACLHFCWD